MTGFFQKMAIKSLFNSALDAAKTNSPQVQRSIAKSVKDKILEFGTTCESLPQNKQSEYSKAQIQLAMEGRKKVNASGNRSEANPEYAKWALIESALVAACSGDHGLAHGVMAELNDWFNEVAVN